MDLFIKRTSVPNVTIRTFACIVLLSIALKCVYAFCYFWFTDAVPSDFSDILNVFNNNDSGWYQNIAENAYPVIEHSPEHAFLGKNDVYQSSWAFFPLYPALVGSIMHLLSVNFIAAAFICSVILVPISVLLFYQLAQYFTPNVAVAKYATLFYLLFPFHYQLSMNYTEALFLSGLFASFLGILKHNSRWIIIGTLIIVLTRPNGVLTLVPLWVFCLEQSKIIGRASFQWNKLIRQSLVFVPAGLIFIAYLYYQYSMTGFYNAFSIAQKGWDKAFMFPFLSLFRFNNLENQIHSFYVVVVMLFTLIHIKKMPLSLHCLIWLNLLLPLTAGSTISMGRYCIVLFPIFYLMSMYCYQSGKMRYVILLLLGCLQLYLFHYWTIADSISY